MGQSGGRAVVDDAAAIHDDDPVEAPQRRQPVRDRDDRAALHQIVQRGLDQLFGFGIQRAGRLIQQQDRRVLQQRPRDRQPLALTAGQHHAAVADHRIESLRQRLDEFAAARGFGGGQHLGLGRVRAAVAQVLPHAAMEQRDVLRHQRHRLAQAGLASPRECRIHRSGCGPKLTSWKRCSSDSTVDFPAPE